MVLVGAFSGCKCANDGELPSGTTVLDRETKEVACANGQVGTQVVKCTMGSLEEVSRSCRTVCGIPTTPNGVFTATTNPLLQDDSVTLTCDAGYRPVYQGNVFCHFGGEILVDTGMGLFTPRCEPTPLGTPYVSAAPSNGSGDGSILQFQIGQNGTLAPAASPMIAAGPNTQHLAIGPKVGSSRYVYASNPGIDTAVAGSISQYSVNAATLQLSALSPATTSTGRQPLDLATTADGKVLVVNPSTSQELHSYTLTSDGKASAASQLAAADSGALCTIGQNLYVSRSSGVAIAQYSVAANGVLAPLNPATLGATSTSSIACAPTGRFVYTADVNSTVFQYSAASGALTPLSPPSVAGGFLPLAMAVSPTEKHLFVMNADDSVSLFTIANNGTLAAMQPPSITAGPGVRGGAFDPTGKNFYVISSDKTIAQFSVGATTVTPLSPATVSTGALVPSDIAAVAP